MLALGGVDGLIRLMVRSPLGDFQASCELKGHGDWVRSVAFTWAGPDSPQGTRCRVPAHPPLTAPPPPPNPPPSCFPQSSL